MTREIKRVTESKKNGKYEVTYTLTDVTEVYKSLAQALIAKKINNCSYIKSIKRVNNYDGTQNITITYDNNVRNIYTVEQH